ncbi:glycosyl hydrolase [Rivibacter subsaxonicus]|uniref:glycosyl hydrolase n=1 Tax=Rivibacter subsaxonicus TaxID=457575 RepID=UPI00102C5965|nr:glycosyl hydrolase [Rivibacter subsaxonicus]
MVATTALALGSISTTAFAQERGAPVDRFVFGPYKDLAQSLEPADPRMATAVSGKRTLLPAAEVLPAGSTLSWAFAVGECGAERWIGLDADLVARANVAAFEKAGMPYIVSTGGEGGVFTCASDEGMARFMARYASKMLRGFDFDIEGKQTPAEVDSLVQRVKTAQRRHPKLRFSFTVATFAASDGGGASLNALGDTLMAAIKRHQLGGAVINLMVMNYGPASAAHCVVGKDGRCDMHASALQAAHNLHRKHGVPYNRIALTAMLGRNDVAENVFTLADAQALARDARALGLAGLHHWSLDRDRACPPDKDALSPTCHSLPGLEPLAFTRALAAGDQAR